MGCDIHLVLEKRNAAGKWVGIDTFMGHESIYGKGWNSPLARSRNYERFAKLAGVRGSGPLPRGIPNELSDTARMLIEEEWGEDGHSHSWLPLSDAAKVWLETQRNPSDMEQKYPASEFFGIDESDERNVMDNYRVVFWFDN